MGWLGSPTGVLPSHPLDQRRHGVIGRRAPGPVRMGPLFLAAKCWCPRRMVSVSPAGARAADRGVVAPTRRAAPGRPRSSRGCGQCPRAECWSSTMRDAMPRCGDVFSSGTGSDSSWSPFAADDAFTTCQYEYCASIWGVWHLSCCSRSSVLFTPQTSVRRRTRCHRRRAPRAEVVLCAVEADADSQACRAGT